MEIFSDFNATYDEPMILPAGFRFHPTDEELITHYLSPKITNTNFTTKAIGEVDLNKVEPWDLPWKAKMGEKEWYFFCVRDRKYPTGMRTNRATEAGYWKATGKDKEIYKGKFLIGMKKTLVFYTGRAPKGEKTNWVMHEFRMEGKNSPQDQHKTAKSEWVICRVFKKSSEGKKVHISGLVKNKSCGINSQPSGLPQLMDLSCDENRLRNVDEFSSSSSSKNCGLSSIPFNFPEFSIPKLEFSTQCLEHLQDQSILSSLQKKNCNTEFVMDYSGVNAADVSSSVSNYEMGYDPCDDQEFNFISTGPVDLDCLWNY